MRAMPAIVGLRCILRSQSCHRDRSFMDLGWRIGYAIGMFGLSKEAMLALGRLRSENQRRRVYHESLLTVGQRDALLLLPVLLHLDMTGLLAKVESDPIHGIACYCPNELEWECFVRYFPAGKGREAPRKKLFGNAFGLEFVYLMGSAGTIAFGPQSDLDLWIGVVQSRFNKDKLQAFTHKVTVMEEWLQKVHGAEVHLFITDLEDLRQNRFGQLGLESCGSSLSTLLKDEFFRTMIHLAGKAPSDWAMGEHSREDLVAIGCIEPMQPREMIGGVLWHMLKGMHSPFKSVLKVGLLESYAHGEPLLSLTLRQRILREPNGLHVDPWIEMIEQVRAHLRKQGRPQDARRMEECFLLKCIGQLDVNQHSRRMGILGDMARNWGWSREEFLRLQNLQGVCFEDQQGLASWMLGYFLQTYGALRAMGAQHPGSISERDLTIMGKVLKARLQKETHKVPLTFSLLESADIKAWKLQLDRRVDTGEHWMVMAELRGSGNSGRWVRMFADADPILVVAWMVVNGFWRNGQTLQVHHHAWFNPTLATAILRNLVAMQPNSSVLDRVMQQWDQKPKTIRLLVVVNADCGELGPAIFRLDALAINTLGELHLRRYTGPVAYEQMVQHEVLLQGDADQLGQGNVRVCESNPSKKIAPQLALKLEGILERLATKAD